MSGETTLEEVWALVDRHVQLKDAKASSAEVKALRAEQKAIAPAVAVEAIEAFLARHNAHLDVKRGPTSGVTVPKTLKLHPLHRALVTHFGFLEVALSPAYWPARSHRDGLRLVGFAPDYPWCDLERLGALHRATQALRAKEARNAKDKAEAAELEPLLPMLTSLEGLNDVWLAGPRSVVASGMPLDQSDRDLAGVSNPRFGATYALLARLRLLEQRVKHAEVAKAFEARCQAIAPVEWTAGGFLRLRADRRVFIDPPRQRLEAGFFPRVHTLLEHRYQGHEFTTDAAQAARAAALSKRVSSRPWTLSIEHSGETMRAEYRFDGYSRPEDLAFGIGAIAHLHRMLADPTLPEFDEVPIAMPAEVTARIEAAGLSAEALRQNLALDGPHSEVVVEAVGQVLPRVRWRIDAAATQDAWSWRDFERDGRAYKVASVPFGNLEDPQRLAQIAQALMWPPRR